MTNRLFLKNKRLGIVCLAKRVKREDSDSQDLEVRVAGKIDQQHLNQAPERPSSVEPRNIVPKTVDLYKALSSKTLQVEKPLSPEQTKFARELVVHRNRDGSAVTLYSLLTTESELKMLLSSFIDSLGANQEQLTSEVQLQALVATMKSYSRVRNNVNQYLSVIESCLANRFNRVRQERGRKATSSGNIQLEVGATLTKVDGTRLVWDGEEWVEPTI